jgi:hypothetical protein
MTVQFHASQSVHIAVPEQPIPIRHYLRQPQRLTHALVDPSRIEVLEQDCVRLKMRPLSFMMLTIQPTVDMRIWADADGVVHLRSVASEIRGVQYINQRFHLDLIGTLAPKDEDGKTYLVGEADLTVRVDLPPALRFTPRAILEATGNGLLQSVLLTVKQRLMHQLLADYRTWVTAQRPSEQRSAVDGGTGLGVALPDSSAV